MKKKGFVACMAMACCLCLAVAFTAGLKADAQTASVNLFALTEYENGLRGNTPGAVVQEGKVVLGEYFSGYVPYSNDYIDAKEFFANERDEYINGDDADFTFRAKITIDSVMAGSRNNGLGLYFGMRGDQPVFAKLQANGKVFINAYNLTSDTTIAGVEDGKVFVMKIEKAEGNISVCIDDIAVVRFAADDLQFATGVYSHYAKGTFEEFSFTFAEPITVDEPTEKDDRPVWEKPNPNYTANTEYIEPPLPTRPAAEKPTAGCASALAGDSAATLFGALAICIGASLLLIKKSYKGEQK